MATAPPPAPSKSETSSGPSPEHPVIQEFQASGDRMRETAKWLAAIFGAIAGVLIAGTQLSSMGSLPVGPRLYAAIGGASLALVGILVVIWFLLDIMLPSQIALDEINDARRSDKRSDKKKKDLARFLESNTSVLAPYSSLDALLDTYTKDLNARQKALDKYYSCLSEKRDEDDEEVKKREVAAKGATTRASQSDRKVGYVAKLLSAEQQRRRFGTGQKVAALLGASVVALGIGVFAWAANPGEDDSADGPELAGATLSEAGLTGADFANANLAGAKLNDANLVGADLSGADLSDADLSGADLRGADLDDVTWSNTTCPDATNSDSHKSTCEGFVGETNTGR